MSEPRLVVLVVALIAIMMIAAAQGMRTRSGAVVLALASVVWLIVDSSFEGDTLLVLSRTHGLTTSDLVGIAGLVIAAVELWRSRRR